MTRIRNVAILKHQPFWASKVQGDLLMGRVKKVSQIGLDKVQCVQVRVPEYRFYEFSKMFYRGWEFHWALDPDQKCGLEDVILIKKAATEQEQFSSTVPYIVDKMVFKYGNLVDPITKRRNYLDKIYEDELVFRRQIVDEIYNDMTTEEDDSMTHETRRERMRQRIEQRRANSRRNQQENRKQKEEEDVNDEFGHSD